MLTYNFQERKIDIKGKEPPEFPEKVVINVSLEPLVPFGGVAGSTRNSVSDQEIIARANLSMGKFFLEVKKPLFEPLDASLTISGSTFQIKKNIVQVQFQCESFGYLDSYLKCLFYAFPAVLNVYLPDAPYPTHAWGEIGESKFQWHYQPSVLRALTKVTSKELQENFVTKSLEHVATVTMSRRLMGGLHYFHVACRLIMAGFNRFEFMAEALLNFSKSLQSLFGHKRDDIRSELAKLKLYSNEEVEGKFMPAMVLRDEFDVAHVSLSLLSREQLKILHTYTNIAESAFRDLMEKLLDKIEKREYSLPSDTQSTLNRQKNKILKRLGEKIKHFDGSV